MDDSFVTDFGKKADVFNTFFAKQCNIFDNGSVIPEVTYKTNKRIMSIIFTSSDLSKTIKEDLVIFPTLGRKEMSFPSIRRRVKIWLKIIDQFPFYQYLGKYLKKIIQGVFFVSLQL